MSRRRLAARSILLPSLALGLLLGGTSPVLAAAPSASPFVAAAASAAVASAEAPQTLGTVDGKLVNEDGLPLGGIRAELLLPDASGPMDFPVAGTYSSYSPQYGDHLDPGSYRFTDVEPGDYVLRFSDDEGTWMSTDYAGTVTVTAGAQLLDDTVLAMAPESPRATLTGLALDAGGEPLVGAYVELFSVIPGRGSRSLGGEFSDQDGRVLFASAPTGVRLTVCTYDNSGNGNYFCQGGADRAQDASFFTIPAPDSEFDFGTLQFDPLLVRGVAVDRAGDPISTGYATLYELVDDSITYTGGADLAEDGSFSLTGATPGGRYVACIARTDKIIDPEDPSRFYRYWVGEFCQGAPDVYDPEVDVFVFPEEGDYEVGEVADPLVVVRGRLVDTEGATTENIGLDIYTLPAGDDAIANNYGYAYSRVDGSFAGRVAPTDDDLTICAYAGIRECLGGTADPMSATTFQIPVSSPIGTYEVGDFVITRRVHIRGVLTRPGGIERLRYYPVHAIVGRPDGGFEVRGFVASFSDEGAFVLILPYTDEPVAVCVFLPSSQPCFGGASPQDAEYFNLPEDGSDYELPSPLALPAGSAIEGRVVTRGGVPQRDVQVSLYELVDSNGDEEPDYANQYNESDVSDPDGRVRIVSDLPGRTVTACAQTYSSNGSQTICLGGAQDPLLADTVTVPPVGETLTLPDLVMRYSRDYCQGAEISNGTIRLGVNCEGELNRYDTGLELVNAVDEDYYSYRDGLIQGCACEGWGVADRTTGTSGSANRNEGTSASLRQVGFASDGTGATAAVEIDEKLLVTHDYQPSELSDYAYDVNVAVENLTTEAMDLAYRRVMDWDVYPTVFNELVSMHTGDVPELTFASNDGFASADPLAGPSDRGAIGDFEKFGPRDQGSLMDFDFGDLPAETTRNLHFVYGVAPSRSLAEQALEAEGAVAWTLAEPSFTEDGAAEGSPNTFFFGYVDADTPISEPAGTNTARPVIAGTPQVGQTLTTDPGTWTPATGLDFSYRWLRDGTAIPNATGTTYVVKQADVDREISVQVTARRDGFTPARAVSVPVYVQAPPSLEVTTPPSIAVQGGGAPEVGAILEVTPGQWTGADEITYSYEWRAATGNGNYLVVQRGGTTLTVPSYLAGYEVFVRETASAVGASSAGHDSNVITIEYDPYLRVAEQTTLRGITKVGEGLTLAPGTWGTYDDDALVDDVEASYEWYVGGRLVSEESSYTPVATDRGDYLYVYVTGTKLGYIDGSDYVDGGRVRGADEVVRPVTVRVETTAGDPVRDVYVDACTSNDCPDWGNTANDGTVVLDLPVVDEVYSVGAHPHNGFSSASKPFTVPAAGPAQLTIVVQAPVAKPDNVTTGDGLGSRPVTDADGNPAGSIPVGYVGRPAILTLEGCPGLGDDETWTVTFASGAAPMSGTFTEDPAGQYTAEVPGFTSGGSATFSTTVPSTCDPEQEPTEFSIYIDPAGVVTDQFGRPLSGAKVTLLRNGGGVFSPVADGDTAVMDPAVNTANPSTTLADGAFRWDVAAGTYQVRLVEGSSGGASCATATTSPLVVPPPRLDLLLKATCAGASAPMPTAAPAVTGARQVDQALSVSTGTWANGIVQTSVQWLRDGTAIPGATNVTYTQVAGDVGKVISARVTAQRPDYRQENGTGEIVSFASFDQVVGAGAATQAAPMPPGGGGGGGGTAVAPTATTAPSVTGPAKVGSTLTANPGTWDTTGLTYSYQWLRGTAPIVGATSATYKTTVEDLDKAVSVQVVAKKAGVPDGTATSSTVTIAKGAAPTTLSPPLVTGEPEVGGTLAVSDGRWDTEGLTFAYQWRRGGEDIAGAAGVTYVVTTADQGAGLSVVVTASRTGYESGQAVSGAVTVPAAPEPEVARDTRTTAVLADSTIKQRQRALLRVFVKALPATGARVAGRPTGQVVVKVDGSTVKRVELSGMSARVDVRLSRLAVGKHRVRAVFVGNEDFARSTSKVLVLKVSKNKRPRATSEDARVW